MANQKKIYSNAVGLFVIVLFTYAVNIILTNEVVVEENSEHNDAVFHARQAWTDSAYLGTFYHEKCSAEQIFNECFSKGRSTLPTLKELVQFCIILDEIDYQPYDEAYENNLKLVIDTKSGLSNKVKELLDALYWSPPDMRSDDLNALSEKDKQLIRAEIGELYAQIVFLSDKTNDSPDKKVFIKAKVNRALNLNRATDVKLWVLRLSYISLGLVLLLAIYFVVSKKYLQPNVSTPQLGEVTDTWIVALLVYNLVLYSVAVIVNYIATPLNPTADKAFVIFARMFAMMVALVFVFTELKNKASLLNGLCLKFKWRYLPYGLICFFATWGVNSFIRGSSTVGLDNSILMNSKMHFVLATVNTCIVAAVVEEFYYRIFWVNTLNQAVPVKNQAIKWVVIGVVSSAIFAYAHTSYSFNDKICMFVNGLGYLVVKEYSGSIIPAIVAHMANNLYVHTAYYFYMIA